MFVQHFIQGFLRLDSRRGRLRGIGPQGLNHHIIGQMVLVARIDGHSLGVVSRGLDVYKRQGLEIGIDTFFASPLFKEDNLEP